MIKEMCNDKQWGFPFVIYKPDKMKEGLPLVIQLHGAGEAGEGGDELVQVEKHGFSNMLSSGEEFPCIFVMPQCSKTSFWVAEIHNIHAFVQKVIQEYHVDANRVYLTGLSMGGYGTWYTALRYPDTFAAIAPICGGGMVWKAGVLHMPIWAFHGTEDPVVNVSETMNMIQKIRSLGENKNVKMTLLDGVKHNAWSHAYNPQLVEWLLSHSKSSQ